MARLTIRIDFDDGRQLGHGKIRLLEMIALYGSISAAGRAMQMSYRRAWLLVEEINRMFAAPLVTKRLGGRGGGCAHVTVLGQRIVELYRAIEQHSVHSLHGQLSELENHLKRK
jgi:molybdate transport system regulatory protein